MQDAEQKTVFADALRNLQAGRLAEAERLYQRILQSSPHNAAALHGLGMVCLQAGRKDTGIDLIRKAITWNSQVPAFHFNLGNVLKAHGELDEAAASYRRAVALKPAYPEAHHNLGEVLSRQGKLEEAAAAYRQALKHKPDLGAAYNNLGNVLKDLGRPEEAIAAYRRAIACKPDLASAHNNLGNILKAQGKLDEAATAYRNALTARPGFAPASSNLALLLSETGQYEAALETVLQSLRGEKSAEAKAVFVECVKHLRWSEMRGEVRDLMVAALNDAWGRPEDLAPAATDLAMLNPDMARAVDAVAAAWPLRVAAKALLEAPDFERLAADPLLRALMASAPICHAGLEHFLTAARHTLLETNDDAHLDFFSALARQCFINDYVFCHTPEEWSRAGKLRDDTAAALTAGKPVTAHDVVTVASYFPLASLPSCERLLQSNWPQTVSILLTQQVREPLEEARDKQAITQLTGIDEAVSIKVRDQYEESPYPRWVKRAPTARPKGLANYLADKFPLASFHRPSAGGIDILIAGCGTGQHAIETAWAFEGARVLAVDLSLSSLAYARRKTRELGVAGISYGHGDLLKLDSRIGSFDVIESVGVLHHLADPWAGWKNLLPLLRPHGFMHIGLYSEIARQKIASLRDWIAKKSIGPAPDDIRQFRQLLMDSPEAEEYRGIIQSMDFCSLSNCRDLLFHVQEHRLTLPAIAEFLRQNDLAFLGFELEPSVLNAYRQCFTGDPAAIDLAQWHSFEQENPGTFAGMYNFWVQRS